MQRSFKSRLAALERLEAAAQGTDRPFSEWPDAELAAYLERAYREWPALRTMSDAELEAICAEEL